MHLKNYLLTIRCMRIRHMLKTLCFVTFLVIGTLLHYSLVSASETIYLTGATSSMTWISVSAGLTPQTSGILYWFYEVKWCSPKYWALWFATVCNKWKFIKVGTKWIISATASGFTTWDVQIANDLTGTIAVGSGSVLAVDLFEWIDSIEIRGEGLFTLNVVLVDRAYNETYVSIDYKIDKTAPTIVALEDPSANTDVVLDPSGTWVLNGLKVREWPDFDEPTTVSFSGTVKDRILYDASKQWTFSIDAKDFQESVSDMYYAGIWNTNVQIVFPMSLSTKYSLTNFATTRFTSNTESTPSRNYILRVYDNTEWRDGTDGNFRDYPVLAIMQKSASGIAVNVDASSGAAVVWVSNLKQSTQLKANVNLATNITRYSLMTDFKKSIMTQSKNITWCEPVNKTLWSAIINNPLADSIYSKCSITVWGETITYIKGNIDIDCVTTCQLTQKKRSIIVKDGSVHIKSNISTYPWNNQLLLWVITSNGLVNVTEDNVNTTNRTDMKWWTLIHPNVTNIDAFIVSEGPMINYNIQATKTPSDTKNQLHIYGGLISLNTSDTNLVPYIINNTPANQWYFSLKGFRSYKLDLKAPWSNILIPADNALRSWGFWKDDEISAETNASGSLIPKNWDTCTTLRCITDKDYMMYPIFIQKNNVWTSSPSVLFKVN